MSKAHELCRGRKRLLPLVALALREGWDVCRLPGGRLKFAKPGLPPIFSSFTVSDARAERNVPAQRRRVVRQGRIAAGFAPREHDRG
jgi:hypothetical protein